MFFSKNESGRTLLEMLAVLVIMAIITVSSVLGYKAIVTKAEVKTVAQEILRVVVERQHEALTKKGSTEHSETISASHDVVLKVQNLSQLKLIEIKAIKNSDELINGLNKFFEDRKSASIVPQTNQVIIKRNDDGYELYLYLRFKQFEEMSAEQLDDYEHSAGCGSGQVWDDVAKECVDDMCVGKTFNTCESCDSSTGVITSKSKYTSCDYDEDGVADDGYCLNSVCKSTACTPPPDACHVCEYGSLSKRTDGTVCNYNDGDEDTTDGVCINGVCEYNGPIECLAGTYLSTDNGLSRCCSNGTKLNNGACVFCSAFEKCGCPSLSSGLGDCSSLDFKLLKGSYNQTEAFEACEAEGYHLASLYDTDCELGKDCGATLARMLGSDYAKYGSPIWFAECATNFPDYILVPCSSGSYSLGINVDYGTPGPRGVRDLIYGYALCLKNASHKAEKLYCQAGEYPSSTSCLACPEGTYSRSGDSICCPQGQKLHDEKCVACSTSEKCGCTYTADGVGGCINEYQFCQNINQVWDPEEEVCCSDGRKDIWGAYWNDGATPYCCKQKGYEWDETVHKCCDGVVNTKLCCETYVHGLWNPDRSVCCYNYNGTDWNADDNQMCCEHAGKVWSNNKCIESVR